MALKSIHRNYVSFFKETTPFVGPADWAADVTSIEFLSCDTSGV